MTEEVVEVGSGRTLSLTVDGQPQTSVGALEGQATGRGAGDMVPGRNSWDAAAMPTRVDVQHLRTGVGRRTTGPY